MPQRYLRSILLTVLVVSSVSPEMKVWAADEPTLQFIDTSFENASPLFWEFDDEGRTNIFLLYDHERSSPNRAAGHWHFRIEAPKGSQQTIILNNLMNVWNGRKSSPASKKSISFISSSGKSWRALPMKLVEEGRLQVTIPMEEASMYVARLEPYDLSDLERFYSEIRSNPLVDISVIGKTVEGRPLEILHVGREDAPYRLLLRARAHAWEPGGNWLVQGLVRQLLKGDAAAKKYLERYCVYILPMTNKDGVARGRTRFNLLGEDLNRKWDKLADPVLAPEKHALEMWLQHMIDAGRCPHFAIDFHNDSGGKVHVSRPEPEIPGYLENMAKFDTLLRKHSMFTEGSTKASFTNPGSIGEGLLQRYGIHACVHELNANWLAGANDYPSGAHWEKFGAQLCEVYYEYFEK